MLAGRTPAPGPEGNGPSKQWRVAGCSVEPFLDLKPEP